MDSSERFSALKKAVVAITIVTVATVAYVFYNPINHKGVYGNKVSYITSSQGRASEVTWLKNQGFNSYVGYGVRDYLSTNTRDVQDFVYSLRKAGIGDVGFVYGSETAVVKDLKAYHEKIHVDTNKFRRSQLDSMRFSFAVSEIEQYQSDGSRPKFYASIKAVSDYALKNKMKRYIYQGWPSQADCDSIVKYSDRVFLHAYGQYDKYSNPGSWVYGYTKTRMAMFAKSVENVYGKNTTYKYNVVLLYSAENPDQAKTQFGYKYYTTNSWESLHSKFMTYYTLNAPSEVKNRIQIGGYQMFVEDQMKKIKP